jgi:hypothetical protein
MRQIHSKREGCSSHRLGWRRGSSWSLFAVLSPCRDLGKNAIRRTTKTSKFDQDHGTFRHKDNHHPSRLSPLPSPRSSLSLPASAIAIHHHTFNYCLSLCLLKRKKDKELHQHSSHCIATHVPEICTDFEALGL